MIDLSIDQLVFSATDLRPLMSLWCLCVLDPECKSTFVIQNVINLRLMMEVTKTGPVSAPILSRKIQKSHFLSTILPMDCVVRTTCNDTIKEYISP